jgi:hypothetical protein
MTDEDIMTMTGIVCDDVYCVAMTLMMCIGLIVITVTVIIVLWQERDDVIVMMC